MKKILFLLATLFASTAYADNLSDLRANGMSWPLANKVDAIYGTALAATEKPATDNSIDLGSSSKQFKSVYVGTSVIFGSGASNQFTSYVPTLVSTPVVVTNAFRPGLNVIPTNAANNAGFLGIDPTVIPGKSFIIINASGAAQRIKAAGGATMNGATAGGYISLASLATVQCFNESATNQVCLQPVIPTPAGP